MDVIILVVLMACFIGFFLGYLIGKKSVVSPVPSPPNVKLEDEEEGYYWWNDNQPWKPENEH